MIQNLADFTEEERKKAMERYRVLEPYLKNLKSVRTVSKSVKIPKRTLYNWINRYKNDIQIIELLKRQIDALNNQIEKQEKHHEMTIEFYKKSYKKIQITRKSTGVNIRK